MDINETLLNIIIVLAVQAFIGLIGIEFALRKSSRFRDGDKARDTEFPAFARRDAHMWSRWKLYPGALLTMPARILLLVLLGLTMILFML